MLAEIIWFPKQGSTTAADVDALLIGLTQHLRRRRACWWRSC